MGGTEREVGGTEREVLGIKREVLGTKREVGRTEREVGGMNLAFLLNITTDLKKEKFYVLQAFVIILPELVSFYGRNCKFDIYYKLIIILILLIPLLVR